MPLCDFVYVLKNITLRFRVDFAYFVVGIINSIVLISMTQITFVTLSKIFHVFP